MSFTSIRRPIIPLVAMVLQGCMALGPKFESLPPPTPDVSKIVVYRPAEFTNSAITPDLYVNGAKTAEITNGGYAAVDVAPGVHRIHLSLRGWTGEATSVAVASGGDISYFRVTTSYYIVYPTGTRTFRIERISESEAGKELAETRRVNSVQPVR